MARPAVFPAFASLVFLGLAASLGAACSSSTTNNVNNNATPDASVVDPKTPEDVPATAIAATTDADCPDGFKDKAPVAGWNRGFTVNGKKRDFWAILPEGEPSGPQPVFIAFNGTSENGQSFATRAKLDQFAKRGFVVLAPSSAGLGELWPIWDSMRPKGKENNPNADIDFVEQMLKCTAAHRPIDKNRVYAGGHSAGGIFTNHIIQRRSELFAGAIVASGVFTSTSPTPEPEMAKMMVLVTWGGDNDSYTGQAGNVPVDNFSFVPEASAATKFYNNQKNVGQANCRGNNLGHAWLPMNDWFVDLLLAHPKGLPGAGNLELAPVPASGRATCTTTPFDAKANITISCGASTTDGCQESCQLFADCAGENLTVSGVLKTELETLGIKGGKCDDCTKRCEAKATSPDDVGVLACIKAIPNNCGQGIQGAFPLIDAINGCCKGKTGSAYCKDVCGIIKGNQAALNYFAACQAF